jgi:choline dehydrogenase
LAENPTVIVLLIEAGGTDDVPAVRHAGQSPVNLGVSGTGGFKRQSPLKRALDSIEYGQGAWRWIEHQRNDLVARPRTIGFFVQQKLATQRGVMKRVLNIYRRIEDWHGSPDSAHRGTGGPYLFNQRRD